MTPDRRTVAEAKRDPAVFAEALVGQELWPHQQQVVESKARVGSICSGRQAGKSRTLAVKALHTAFAKPRSLVLLISAGDAASRDLLAHTAALAQAPWLGSSVLDESQSRLTLSNGSEIRSVPASVKQIRGKSVDLLIVDEAAQVDETVWQAAQWTVMARENSRVLLASTPWGRQDRFFALAYRAGLAGEDGYASWHWPSTASPLVDQTWLDIQRKTSTDRAYRAEVLAEWVEDAGAYFTAAELEGCIVDRPLLPPAQAGRRPVTAGIDWGFSTDANALVLLSKDAEIQAARGVDGPVFLVTWCEERFATLYADWVDTVADAGNWRYGGYRFEVVHSECNGVGAAPTQMLRRALVERGAGANVVDVNTTASTKENCFGALKLLAQQRRLAIPREATALLRQLSNLGFETTDGGTVRIAVPEVAGHDDLAMALCLAASRLPQTVSLGRNTPNVPGAATSGVIRYPDTPSANPTGVIRRGDPAVEHGGSDGYTDPDGTRNVGVGGRT